MSVTRSQATEQQRANFLEAGVNTRTAIETAIRLLRARQALTGDPDEARRITVALLELESDAAKVQADIVAFLSEQRSIEPPSAQQLERVKDAARRIEGFTANAAITNSLLATTTELISQWNRSAV